MNFESHPIPPDPSDENDDPRVMKIGDGGRRWWRAVLLWLSLISVVAATLVLLFIRFGATVLWASALVGFMLAYMGLMSRWAGGDHDRRW
jgi:hypothetical protein